MRFLAMRCLALCVGLVGLTQAAAAAEVTAWQMPARLSYGFGTDAASTSHAFLEVRPGVEVGFAPGVHAQLSGRLRLDAADELVPGTPDYDSYSDFSKPVTLGSRGTLELRDAYLEFELDHGLARIGKQQIVWGRLDGIKVLDVLNPQRYSEFILEDFGLSRIGLWSAYVDQTLGDWRVELAVIPDASGHEIPEQGAWFELRAPRFRYGAAPDDPAPPVRTVRDRSGWEATSAGLQLSRFFGTIGFSAMAYSGVEHEPLGRIVMEAGGPVLEQYYKRRNLLGFNADAAFGSVALRTEFAWQPDRTFNTRSEAGLATVERDQFTLALGADVLAPLDLFLNLQFQVDKVMNAPATLVRPDSDHVVTALVRRSFNYETVLLEARLYASLDDGDRLVSLSGAYEFSNGIEVEMRFETFGGDREGLFGQFRERDRLLLELRHHF